MALWFLPGKLGCGTLEDCRPAAETAIAVVHACKDPCHRAAVGYTGKSLDAAHPAYLGLETDAHLALNLIDPPLPLFKPESFDLFFRFADREIAQRPVLIHCNKGQSRAPSLALLYMAKRLRLLPDENYDAAREAFTAYYPAYKPGDGIALYLAENWTRLGQDL